MQWSMGGGGASMVHGQVKGINGPGASMVQGHMQVDKFGHSLHKMRL